jgi:hypothetical protein
MRRVRHVASIRSEVALVPLATRDTWAWNSAVRASEALAREQARELGVTLEGETPLRIADRYTRRWFGPGGVVLVTSVRVA